jgi:hypothetical protein
MADPATVLEVSLIRPELRCGQEGFNFVNLVLRGVGEEEAKLLG